MRILKNDNYHFGMVRVAAITPSLEVANCAYNVDKMIEWARKACNEHVRIALFPELGITGYTCGDLFHQQILLQQAENQLIRYVKETASFPLVSIVGLPLQIQSKTHNVAAVIGRGRIYGLVPKSFLPTYNEFYEKRWFASPQALQQSTVVLMGQAVPVGVNLLFHLSHAVFSIEICEDLWSPLPPSCVHTLKGADIIFNPSASTETTGKSHYRRSLVVQQSARCLCGYVYAASGVDESSTDVVFSGHNIIAENGEMLTELPPFSKNSEMIIADVDVEKIRNERARNSSFSLAEYPMLAQSEYKHISLDEINLPLSLPLKRSISPMPFVPLDEAQIATRCQEVFDIQVSGLCKRLKHTSIRKCVIGISGGLDSTLALLVAVRAFDKLNIPRSHIYGITMPGFGTSGRTKQNALQLMDRLQISSKEIPIAASVLQHFADIEHDPTVHDVTYENAQARERTQILMDYANKIGALVIGTGDLSELALGWCTYNGDHMSMYAVNAGVPKTLVKALVQWTASQYISSDAARILCDVVDTPVSPELLPANGDGEIAQQTEDIIGPYRLHDFFLYHMVRNGFEPQKIYLLAKEAFQDEFSPMSILRCLEIFVKRFFTQQFKRSCMPDGPKVGSINLSPRGDWRMPSDASYALWIKSIEELKQSLLK